MTCSPCVTAHWETETCSLSVPEIQFTRPSRFLIDAARWAIQLSLSFNPFERWDGTIGPKDTPLIELERLNSFGVRAGVALNAISSYPACSPT
jgi:hypothetical protein